MRAAVAEKLGAIDLVELREEPEPTPTTGQVRVAVHGAAVGPWDPAFVVGGFPGVTEPFVPGQEIAGVVEAVGDGADLAPGDRVYGSLFPAGGGFAEYAVAPVGKLAAMPAGLSFEEAASLVIGAGTAHEGLVDKGHLQAGETVLVTAAAGGVGSSAVQIVAALGARPLGLASSVNHDFLRGLGTSDVFDYHDSDWPRQVLAVVPGGVDLLFDAAGGQTRDQAVTAVRDGGRVITVVPQPVGGQPAFGPFQLDRGVTGESFAAHVTRQRLEALSQLVDAGQLRPQLEAVLPLDQARAALERVAGQHTRGKVVLQVKK